MTAIISGDPLYAPIDPADVGVTNLDDDVAGVTVTPTTVNVTEGGSDSSYSVALTTQPTGNVTITLSVGVHASVSPAQLVFTPGNWNTAQSVAVSAVDDALAEGAHVETITHRGQQRRQLQRHRRGVGDRQHHGQRQGGCVGDTDHGQRDRGGSAAATAWC